MAHPRRLLSLALAAWLAVVGAGAAEEGIPALYRVTGVAADDVLNVRSAPDAAAEKVGELAPGAAGVEISALSADGRWGRINLAESPGWVSMRYLERESAAGWDALEAPLFCYGTEPFWSLDIAPGAGSMRLAFDDKVREIGPSERWPGPVSGPRALGLALGAGGFAAVEAEACNDGMSENMHGLSILLFLADRWEGEPGALHGCCTLSR